MFPRPLLREDGSTDWEAALCCYEYAFTVMHPCATQYGKRHDYTNRIWLLKRNGDLRPLLGDGTSIAHEWWDSDGQHVWYVDYNQGTYSWKETGCSVEFFNMNTGKEAVIAGNLPLPPYPRPRYHLDPHPQFCAEDRFVVYTTTVRGRVDVAVVKTADLIAATS
jgi:hypothetical protein